MTIDPATAAGAWDYHGTRYYFCHPSCLERFKATPEEFLSPKTEIPSARVQGATYVCPMDPEIRQDHPGACPKCGMALEPDLSTLPATRVEYTCPMHPEIVRDCAGRVPDLRHGARAAHGDGGRGAEPRAGRHDAPVHRRRAARRAGVSPDDGRHGPRDGPRRTHRSGGHELDRPGARRRRSCSGAAGRSSSAAGRRSSTAARTCSRSSRSAWARRTCYSVVAHDRARALSRRLPHRTAPSRPTSTPRSSSSRSCCSGRCSSCAREARRARAIRQLLGLAPKTARVIRDGPRRGRAARRRRGRRSAARPARREGSGRRRRARGTQLRRRIDGDRRADAGREGARRARDRRNDQRHGHAA